MAIRYTNILCAVALVGVTTLVTSRVVSQQHDEKMAEMQEMMEAWEKLAQPGEQHEMLMQAAGTWRQENTYWMYPGAEPTTSTSMAEMKPILGGRFLLETIHGKMEFMGEVFDFEGMGILGYDNMKQKHTFAWLDNMGTMIMTAEGTADPTGKVITYIGEMPNPMGDGVIKMKSVSRVETNDRHIFEMHEKTPGSDWRQNMRIVQTRVNEKNVGVHEHGHGHEHD